MKVKGIVLAVLVAFAPLAGAAHAKTYCERLYDSARRDYYSLLESPRKQKFHDNWERVIEKFEKIVDQYPSCSRAPDSLFNVGVLYSKLYRVSWVQEDLRSSLRTYQNLEKEYPKSSLADDALFNAGEILEEMGDKEKAYLLYARILDRYPKGDMARKAKSKTAELAAFAPKPPSPKPAPTVVSTPGSALVVTDVRYWSNPDYTRVVVTGTGAFRYEENQLRRDDSAGKPPRLYIDIKDASIPKSLCDPIPIADGLLLQARIAQYDPRTVRLVLDIDSMKDHRVFSMENPSRLVIDVIGDEGRYNGRKEGEPRPSQDSPLPLAQQLGLGIKRIVLDPGHGGKDPGAIGPRGLKEKEVTLDLARRLKPLLERQGYEVLMTRNSDVFIPLHERTAFANQNRADLFISIHTNASRNSKVRGIETYFLGVAKSREASETAMLENAISQQALSDLEKILFDLTRTSNLKQSSDLAESIQQNLVWGLNDSFRGVPDLGVKQASFYVLIGAQMPAVLVETSFISNPTGEGLLSREDYRDQLAQSIFRGILSYAAALSPAQTGKL
jgi:N-acetylmuramoyl-L-alanine amidase